MCKVSLQCIHYCPEFNQNSMSRQTLADLSGIKFRDNRFISSQLVQRGQTDEQTWQSYKVYSLSLDWFPQLTRLSPAQTRRGSRKFRAHFLALLKFTLYTQAFQMYWPSASKDISHRET
jgi:hypothetical protein